MLLAIGVFCGSTQVFAQNLKFGHVNMTELVALMPERDSAVVKLEKYAKDLDETMQTMQAEMQKKYQEYTEKSKDWLPAVLQAKENELNEMNQRLQQFDQTARQEMANMQQQLLSPILQKANEAVDKLGKEQGFTYIFDVSAGSLLFIDENVSVDLMPMAKSALGIPADKTLPQQSTAQN